MSENPDDDPFHDCEFGPDAVLGTRTFHDVLFTDDTETPVNVLTGETPAHPQATVQSLVNRAQESGLDIDEQKVWDAIDDRTDAGEEPVTYSWVHLNKFRKFELHERCFPWTTVDELPSLTPRPEWEERESQ
jgi:hypothetical protein